MEVSKKIFTHVMLFLTHNIARLRRIIFWAPILTLVLGFGITGYLYVHLKQRDEFIQKTIFTQSAREELTKIDLLLTNSILKIQSYESNLEDRPRNYKKDEPYLDLVLRHTLFQRLSILQEQPDKKIKVILRITTPDSTLPDPTSNYITAEDIKKHIYDLRKTSGLLTTIVYERNDTPYLSVILRSKVHNSVFFLFTTPLINLFNQTLLSDSASVIASTNNAESSWIIQPNGIGKVISRHVRNKENSSLYNVRFTNTLPQSNVNLSLEFNDSPMMTNYMSPENMTAVMGILLTLVVSMLFYNLINQNRVANSLIISKTIALEKTANDLQTALNSKANFFGKISHEIRTPLNLILGMIDLATEANSDKVVQNYLKTIHTSGEHLLSMMDDLIDLAQAEKNEMTFQERTIYLAQFLGDVCRLAGQDCKQKGLQIYLHFDKNMPACILTDPNRLRQVLINLLRNACKYTQEGHVILAVTATESIISQKIKLKFEIKDSGIGIPQDHLNKVFDAFFQVENSRTYSEGGVGLGLSIVKDIVKKMNGKVSVSSAPKKGSTFTVEFEFSRPEKVSWYDIYKSVDHKRYTIILLSKDQLLQKSFAALSPHINVEEIIYLEDDFAKVLFHKDPNRNYWIVLDPMTATMDIDILTNAFGRNVFVLGQNKPPQVALAVTYLGNAPFLPYEILTLSGFSSRSRQRKHLSGLLNPASKVPDNTAKDLSLNKDFSIIVADDDQGNIELYKAYFANSAWKIDYNYDGTTAWESFENKLPDLLILDVRMPNMDGFELLERIRGYEKRRNIKPIPVILVTADLLDYTAQTAKTFESVTLLSKPIKKKVLFDTIQNVSLSYSTSAKLIDHRN